MKGFTFHRPRLFGHPKWIQSRPSNIEEENGNSRACCTVAETLSQNCLLVPTHNRTTSIDCHISVRQFGSTNTEPWLDRMPSFYAVHCEFASRTDPGDCLAGLMFSRSLWERTTKKKVRTAGHMYLDRNLLALCLVLYCGH